MPPKRHKPVRRADELLGETLGVTGHSARSADIELRRAWPLVVGGPFARNVRPAFSQGEILFLDARTDAWAEEARNLSGMILEHLHERGLARFREVRVRTRRWADSTPGGNGSPRVNRLPAPPPGALPPDVETRLAEVADTELRDAVRAFVYRHQQARKPG